MFETIFLIIFLSIYLYIYYNPKFYIPKTNVLKTGPDTDSV